jgi:hypothetical protein
MFVSNIIMLYIKSISGDSGNNNNNNNNSNNKVKFTLEQATKAWGPGRVRKISPSPGFDPRTVQPVASRYTDWADWGNNNNNNNNNNGTLIKF